MLGQVCTFRPATNFSGSHFNRGENAVWLGVEWVNEPHEAHEIFTLANDLARHQIRYVFVYASYLKPDGQFNPTYAYAAEFVSGLKRVNPDIHIQAWIGLPPKCELE
jgi:hypothetical protein